jgi:hypothetical protein
VHSEPVRCRSSSSLGSAFCWPMIQALARRSWRACSLSTFRVGNRSTSPRRSQGAPCRALLAGAFGRQSSGDRMETRQDRWRSSLQGSDAPAVHGRTGYSWSGCTPPEPDAASPGVKSLADTPHHGQGTLAARTHRGSTARGQNRQERSLGSSVEQSGKDAPLEIKNFLGVPVKGVLTSNFLKVPCMRV